MKPEVLIWASLLAGDFGRLEDSALKAQEAGADALHIDIMDGNFVPNISMGADVVRMARRCLRIPLNVHLMVARPDLHARSFIEAGADWLSIHVEARCDVTGTLRLIRELGAKPGLALNPETPAHCATPFLSGLDSVLCMTVHPGFGGQSFMPEVLPKIAELRGRIGLSRDGEPLPVISVDGGINPDTGVRAAEAGANALVAGSALFNSGDMAKVIAQMRRGAEGGLARCRAGEISLDD